MLGSLEELAVQRVEAWYEAVSARHSRRAYDGRRCSEELLDRLDATFARFRPYPDARVELVRDPAVEVFRGAVGSYGKIVGAPHVLVVIGTDQPSSQQHAGYTGEGCILEATALGVDTCWVGGFFDRDRVASLLDLSAEDRVFAVSPLGYATDGLTSGERLMRGMAGAHKRKRLDQIAENPGAHWPAWALSGVECARLAPSAVNRQPWRFSFADDVLSVSRTAGPELPAVTKALDCGIAMLHAELGARMHGAPGAWHDSSAGLRVADYRLRGEAS